MTITRFRYAEARCEPKKNDGYRVNVYLREK